MYLSRLQRADWVGLVISFAQVRMMKREEMVDLEMHSVVSTCTPKYGLFCMNLQAFRCSLIVFEAMYCCLGYRQDDLCLDNFFLAGLEATFEPAVHFAPSLQSNCFPHSMALMFSFHFARAAPNRYL